MRILNSLFDVFDRDQPFEIELLIHHQQLLDPMFVQDLARFLERRAFGHRDEIVLRHHLRDFEIHAAFETKIAVCENPDELAQFRDRNS